MCMKRDMDEGIVLSQTKMLLKIYRGSGWFAAGQPEMLEENGGTACALQPGILEAINYLECLDPDQDEVSFEDHIEPLFETRWMYEIISMTMNKVRDFPTYGKTYHTILHDSFFSMMTYSEKEMLALLGMERSVFYDRKKEAIMTFAVALWNTAIPKIRAIACEPETLQMQSIVLKQEEHNEKLQSR